MNTKLIAAGAALAALLAGSAMAGTPVVAKLAAPVPGAVKFIAGGAMFNCEGDTCVAAVPTSQTYSAATCKQVADKAGVITSFGFNPKALDETKLATCNAKAIAKAGQAEVAAK